MSLNKERVVSKIAFESALCIPAAVTWFVGVPTIFEDRPLMEKVVRLGAIGALWVIGGVIGWRVGSEAYRNSYHVDRTPSKDNPSTSLVS